MLIQPGSPEQWAAARALVEEYAASLQLDLDFQNFDDEIEWLPRLQANGRAAALKGCATVILKPAAELKPAGVGVRLHRLLQQETP